MVLIRRFVRLGDFYENYRATMRGRGDDDALQAAIEQLRVSICASWHARCNIAGMDTEALPIVDPTSSNEALRAACSYVRDNVLSGPVLLRSWLALQQGWRAHMERHERYAQSRLRRRDPQAAARVTHLHWEIAAKLEQHAIDLKNGNVCADVSARNSLGALIAHLIDDADCKLAIGRRRGRAAS